VETTGCLTVLICLRCLADAKEEIFLSSVIRGATSRNTIAILDIELCERAIGGASLISLISLIGVLNR